MLLEHLSLDRQEVSYAFPHADRILILAPHADDETLGCGGSILKYSEKGSVVKVILLTDGAKGGRAGNLVEKRNREHQKAMEQLNCEESERYHFEDGKLKDSLQLRKQLKATLGAFRPKLVLVPYIFDLHSDHQQINLSLAHCLNEGRENFAVAMYETLTPILHPNIYIDISDFFGAKLKAIKNYESQIEYLGIDKKITVLNNLRAEMSFRKRSRQMEAFKYNTAQNYTNLIFQLLELSFFDKQEEVTL